MSSSDEFGTVEGYEFQVVCPECGYPTDGKHLDGKTIFCGDNAPGNDDHGCGAKLEVIVRAG